MTARAALHLARGALLLALTGGVIAKPSLDLNIPHNASSIVDKFGNASFCVSLVALFSTIHVLDGADYDQCWTLKLALPNQTSYPGDSVYEQEQKGPGILGYWSATEVRPSA